MLRAAGSISAFTLLSRIFGLVRDSLMTTTLGAGWVQGTFLLAWTLPNLMRRLLGEGALSASFVPAYAAAKKRGQEEQAKKLLAQVAGAVTTLLLPICLTIAVASLLVPAEWLPAPEKGGVEAMRLLLLLNAILFPYALPVCLTAVLSGALNTLGAFALPAAVPIALNVFWIAALLAAPALGFTIDTEIATFVAVCLAVGGVAQLGLVLWPLWRLGELPRIRLGLPKRGTAAFAVFAAMGPTVLGMSLNQISSLLDQLMAYAIIAPGAVTYIYLANRLLLFPHALTAMAVAVAVFPKLAADATEDDRGTLRRTLDQAGGATLFVTMPASFGLIVLAEDIVRVLFEGGQFTAADVEPTVWTCSCLVAGLPFLGLAQLYARAFYAVGDMRTPPRAAMRLVVANAVLNVVLLATTNLGTAGLALSSSLSSLGNCVILARAFRRHAPQLRTPWGPWLRATVATAAMCAVLPLLRIAADDASRMTRALGNVALPIGVGMLVYCLVQWLLRSPEMQLLRRRRR
ncbi:MAG: hypothetical protein RL398_2980 [Planctomycetota bacterium]